jgi:plastocyanin
MYTFLYFFSFISAAFAATHTVEVGDDGKFIFNPDTLTAAVGDSVIFEFYPGPHSVSQSTFDNPCQPSPGGIYSGFFMTSSGLAKNVFEIEVTSTDPIWLYCSQIGHCNAGMAMVINPP